MTALAVQMRKSTDTYDLSRTFSFLFPCDKTKSGLQNISLLRRQDHSQSPIVDALSDKKENDDVSIAGYVDQQSLLEANHLPQNDNMFLLQQQPKGLFDILHAGTRSNIQLSLSSKGNNHLVEAKTLKSTRDLSLDGSSHMKHTVPLTSFLD